MLKKLSSIILSLTLVAISLSAYATEEANEILTESSSSNPPAASRYQGYAIYRDGVSASWISGGWHAAIQIEPLATSTNYAFVHATGGAKVGKTTWSGFMGGSDNMYQGLYKPKLVGISKYWRYNVYETAIELQNENITYTALEQVSYNADTTGNYVNPKNITSMRCDGVVEYCYEYNGIRIYGSDANWDVSLNDENVRASHFGTLITPKKQAQNYMTAILPPNAFPTDDNSEP